MKFVIEEDPKFTYGANDTRSILLYMVAERGFEDIKYDHLLAFHQLSVIMGRTALHDTIVFNDKGNIYVIFFFNLKSSYDQMS